MASFLNKVADAVKPGREAENEQLYGTGPGSHLAAYHNHIPGEFPETPAGEGQELGGPSSSSEAPTGATPDLATAAAATAISTGPATTHTTAPAATSTSTGTEHFPTTLRSGPTSSKEAAPAATSASTGTEHFPSTLRSEPASSTNAAATTSTSTGTANYPTTLGSEPVSSKDTASSDLGGLSRTGATEAFYTGSAADTSKEVAPTSAPADTGFASVKPSTPISDAASTTAVRSGHVGHPVNTDVPPTAATASATSYAPASSSPLVPQSAETAPSSTVPSSTAPTQESSHLGRDAALGVGAGAGIGAAAGAYAHHKEAAAFDPAATPDAVEYGSVANVSSTTARSFPLSSSATSHPATTQQTAQPQTAPSFAQPVVTHESTFVQPPTSGSTAAPVTATQPTTTSTAQSTAPLTSEKQSEHHYGRDAAILGTGATAVGVGAHEHEKKEQPVHNSAILNKLDPRVDSTSAAAQSQAGTQSSTSTTQSTAPVSSETQQQHHYGRDAAVLGTGVAAVGVGAHEHEKKAQPVHDSAVLNKLDPRVDSTSTAQTQAATQPTTSTAQSTAPVASETQQQHHYGRDAAVLGTGAGAVGLAAHEHDKKAEPVHDSQTANKLDPRVDTTSTAAAGRASSESPVSATSEKKKVGLFSKLTGRHKHDKEEQSPESPTSTKEHHAGRDTAIAGAGAVGAYEVTKKHSEHSETSEDGTPQRKPSLLSRIYHGRLGEEYPPKDAGHHAPKGSAIAEHPSGETDKDLIKDQKHERKEAEKEQEAIGKQIYNDEREHEKFLKEERKLHEKEAEESRKRDEKEAKSLKKDPAIDVTAAVAAASTGAAYEHHKHGHTEYTGPKPMAHSQTVAGTDPMPPDTTMATADPYAAGARAQQSGLDSSVARTTAEPHASSGLATDPDQTTQSAHYPAPAADDVQAVGYGTGRSQPEGGIEGMPASAAAISEAEHEPTGVHHNSTLLNKLDPRVHDEKSELPANVDPLDPVHKARVNAVAFGGTSTFDDQAVRSEQIMHPDHGVATGETEAAARHYQPDPNEPEDPKKKGLRGLFHRSHNKHDGKPGYQQQAEDFYEREKNYGADVPGGETDLSGSQHNKLRKPPPTS